MVRYLIIWATLIYTLMKGGADGDLMDSINFLKDHIDRENERVSPRELNSIVESVKRAFNEGLPRNDYLQELNEYETRRMHEKDRFDKKKDISPENRRILDWFKRLFKKRTKNNFTSTTTAPIEDEPLLVRDSDIELKVILNKLITILKQINENLTVQNEKHKENKTNGYFVLTMPSDDMPVPIASRSRVKRSVDNDTLPIANDLEYRNDDLEVFNQTNDIAADNSSLDNNNTRRNMAIYEPNEIKRKLLSYLNDTFYEIRDKLTPLQKTKKDYAGEVGFKIGYIIANIDTLDLNLAKLRKDMDLNKHLWDDKKILELFDKLKVSNNVVTNLLDSLKMYTDAPRNPIY